MEKKNDAVALMRELRSRLSARYSKAPHEELAELRKKYGNLRKKKRHGTCEVTSNKRNLSRKTTPAGH